MIEDVEEITEKINHEYIHKLQFSDTFEPNCKLIATKNLKFYDIQYKIGQEFEVEIKWALGPTLTVILENKQVVTLYVYDSYFENVKPVLQTE